jgi:hypothetical protein
MHGLAWKCDPNPMMGQRRRIRNRIENTLQLLATDIARVATGMTASTLSKKFALRIALNPCIFKATTDVVLSSEEVGKCRTPDELQDAWTRKLQPHIARMIPSKLLPSISITGDSCWYYLRGYCFLTMKALLYATSAKLFGVRSKDKMERMVGRMWELWVATDGDGRLV